MYRIIYISIYRSIVPRCTSTSTVLIQYQRRRGQDSGLYISAAVIDLGYISTMVRVPNQKLSRDHHMTFDDEDAPSASATLKSVYRLLYTVLVLSVVIGVIILALILIIFRLLMLTGRLRQTSCG